MTRRRTIVVARRLALAGAALLVLACPTGSAQQRAGSGRALDGSLQVGSGGYNRPTRSRDFVERPLYTVGSSGALRYNPYNAFGVQRQFQPQRPPTSGDLRYNPERQIQAAAQRMPDVDVRPQPTAGTSMWTPRSSGQFMTAPVYRPAGPGSKARPETGTTALGVAHKYEAGSSGNPYGVSSLFGG